MLVLSPSLTVVTITPITNQHAEKDGRQLTFVAMSNGSQAKEEKGEQTHSGHLREKEKEEAEGREGEREDGKNTCIKLTLSSER